MSNNISKKNGIRFFLFLIIFSSICIYITKKVDISEFGTKNTIEEIAQQCASCGNNQEEEILQEDSNYVVYDLTEEEALDITEYVKAASSSGLSDICKDPANKVDLLRRLCRTSGVSVHHEVPKKGEETGSSGGKVNTQKINGFRLTKVTYPLAFWLGKYTMETSNREITTTDAAFSSNGQQIDPNYQLKTLSPQQSTEVLSAALETERKPFEVTGNVSVGADKQLESKDGIYNVENADHDPICGCPKEVSTSDYNVGATNYISSEGGGYWRQQIPGGDNYDYNINEECISKSDISELNEPGLWTACAPTPLMSFFKGLFKSSYTTDKWNYCDEDGVEVCDENGENCKTETQSCIDPRDITVYMTPIFGEVFKCTNGICGNSFLTYSYMGTLSPQQSDRKEEVAGNNDDSLMYFIATPCEGVLEFEDGGKEMELTNLKCLWDATPTLMNYKLQAKDKIPDQENFPKTFEEYWDGVEIGIDESAIKYKL